MEYRVVFSKRRTVGITVKDGEVTVRAPHGTPSRIIEKAVTQHAEWIEKVLAKQEKEREMISSLTDADIAALKKNAKRVLKQKTEEFSKIMNLKYGRITITSAKTGLALALQRVISVFPIG